MYETEGRFQGTSHQEENFRITEKAATQDNNPKAIGLKAAAQTCASAFRW